MLIGYFHVLSMANLPVQCLGEADPTMLRPIVTCEHGGREVPGELAELFAGQEDLLAGHRGWDPGALELAERLAARLGAPLHAARTTRLVADLNRSAHSPELLSERTRTLSAGRREAVLAAHWRPYRRAVEEAAAALAAAAAGPVLHLSIHSFTPVLDGVVRDLDLGLLFDPSRDAEVAFCHRLGRALGAALPTLVVADNRPYLGTADGLTTHLRGRLPPERYLGIELEVNQRHPLGDPAAWAGVMDGICAAVAAAREEA